MLWLLMHNSDIDDVATNLVEFENKIIFFLSNIVLSTKPLKIKINLFDFESNINKIVDKILLIKYC